MSCGNCGGSVVVSTRGQQGPPGSACYQIITANATATPNVYVSNSNAGITSYPTIPTIYEVILETSNIAGAATLNINGLGAFPLQKGEIGSEHDMLADEIQSGETIRVLFQNSIFLLIQRNAEEMRFSHMLYVDITYGNDTYAEKYNKEKPYQTIAAAQTAAVSGDTIYVFPGTYTVGNLGKDGVNYYFEDGYIYTGSSDWFGDSVTTTVVTCKISGYARGVNCGRIVFSQNAGAAGSSYSFVVRSWVTTATTVWATFNGSSITCKWIDSISTSAGASNRLARLQNQNGGAITAANFYFEGPIARCRSAVFAQSSGTCVFNVNCYFDIDASTAYGTSIATGMMEAQGQGGGAVKIYHEGNITADGILTTNDDYGMFKTIGASDVIESHSNIIKTNSAGTIIGHGNPSTLSATSSAGTTKHYGNVITSGSISFTRGNPTFVFELNGNYIAAVSAYNNPAIDLEMAVTGSITINGLVKNSTNNAASHVVAKTNGSGGAGDFIVKILQGTRLVATNASAYTLSANATVPTFNVFNGACGNNAINPGAGFVVQKISSLQISSDVS